ncbi:MAG: response regulator, partial [Pseudanabaena sp. CAN_BIN31]|nr:response regulator [Pseudanabaena sp. CAN_BIN31]
QRDNGDIAWHGVILDVTAQKQAEERLQKSEAALVEAQAIAHIGSWAFDIQSQKITWSKELFHMFGLDPNQPEPIFVDYLQMIHPDDRVLLQQCVERASIDGTSYTIDYRVIQPDYSIRYHEGRGEVERNEQGQTVRLFGTNLDITDRKQIELELIKAKEAAEAATKVKSEFLANMSHEIRTPMNGVLGMTELLETTSLDEEQQDFVKTIKESGDALLTVINDILDFSKIESGMLEIEAHDFDLREVVIAVCKLLENQANTKQINLQYTIASDVPTNVIGDRNRLRQILLNLIGNAIKFTHDGGVDISITGQALPESNKYQLKFAIADTGIGIQGDRIDKLFQPFTQADNSTSRKYGGTGLGLAISKRLVELMHGTIWVESCGQVGGDAPKDWQAESNTQGSIFHFAIAVSTNSAITPPQKSKKESQTKQMSTHPQIAEQFPLKILLVEDNKFNQMVAIAMFKRLGYQIDNVANNGLEALQAIENQSFDLVLMDVQMPEMDGLIATKIIRTKLMSQVKIVAMTANVSPEDRQVCLDAGMDDYISKPINMQKIINALSQVK